MHYSSPVFQNLSTFTPVSELAHNDSNLIISAVSFNSAHWMWTLDDPLFSAHLPTEVKSDLSGLSHAQNETLWMADFPLKAVACLEQVSFRYSIDTYVS